MSLYSAKSSLPLSSPSLPLHLFLFFLFVPYPSSAQPTQCYTIAIGKINPAKMANFMEVDVFVLVACPENSLLDSQVSQCRKCATHNTHMHKLQKAHTFT